MPIGSSDRRVLRLVLGGPGKLRKIAEANITVTGTRLTTSAVGFGTAPVNAHKAELLLSRGVGISPTANSNATTPTFLHARAVIVREPLTAGRSARRVAPIAFLKTEKRVDSAE